MKIIRNWQELPPAPDGQVIALGNFDGVHIGHRRLITEAVQEARSKGIPSMVLTFDPHPLQVLNPEAAPRLITATNKKAELIKRLGVDLMFMMPFTLDLAARPPEYFALEVLGETLHTYCVFIGFNYTFGQHGTGTPETLRRLGKQAGFSVMVIPPVMDRGAPVSSTVVRQALEDGNIEIARRLLGYWPALEGVVVSGDRRGREIGFPTANLEPSPEMVVPGRGVYAAKVRRGSRIDNCVVNIGVKPTFMEEARQTIEIHILEFNGDLYGQELELMFCSRIRPEKRFASVEELITQIRTDVVRAEQLLAPSS